MENREYKFDVAFSFNSLDEGIATQLNDLLSDRLKTFIYSERQKEIAGTDGQESFSQVYGATARLVVVMYRPEWGQSPWTRIEMNAIKNRSLEDGWDFSVFIPTVERPTMPPWLPKTRLYVGLQRWGIEGAAAVIEARLADQGGEPHPEMVTERAARFARAAKLKVEKEMFRRSDGGVLAANAAYAAFGDSLDERITMITPLGVQLVSKRSQEYRIVSGAGVVNLICSWRPYYANNMENVFLNATFYKGFPELPGFMPSFHEAIQLRNLRFSYELVRPDYHAWVLKENEGRRDFSPLQLAEYLLHSYLDIAEKTGTR
jgi:hypothetical protein